MSLSRHEIEQKPEPDPEPEPGAEAGQSRTLQHGILEPMHCGHSGSNQSNRFAHRPNVYVAN